MNVVNLTLQAKENVVKALEEHLEAAKAGHIIGFCIAYENEVGGTGYHVSLGEGSRPHTIIGQLYSASILMSLNTEESQGGHTNG